MTPEGKIEKRLHERVRATGGQYRRLRWLGRRNAPDDLCWWPDGTVVFVECKRPGEVPRPAQAAEHRFLLKTGLRVFSVDSNEAIELLIGQLTSEIRPP